MTHDVILFGIVVGCLIGLAFTLYSWWADPDTKHEFINKYEYY
jgi:hypothetical protein